ncbi:unnamed protein product, partial [Strongylus vulgaris]
KPEEREETKKKKSVDATKKKRKVQKKSEEKEDKVDTEEKMKKEEASEKAEADEQLKEIVTEMPDKMKKEDGELKGEQKAKEIQKKVEKEDEEFAKKHEKEVQKVEKENGELKKHEIKEAEKAKKEDGELEKKHGMKEAQKEEKEHAELEKKHEVKESEEVGEVLVEDGLKKEADEKKKRKKKLAKSDQTEEVGKLEPELMVNGAAAEKTSETPKMEAIEEKKKPPLALKINKQDFDLKIGDSCDLTIESSDEVKFEWTKDDLSLSSAYSQQNSKNRTTVRITSATLEMAGKYKCVATNKEGVTATATITVNVKGVPIAEAETNVVEVKIGETAKLFVNVRGATDVKCEWSKDGKPIKATKTMTSSYKDGTAQLVIKSAEITHSGVYKLKASNADGSAEADVTLIVKSVPSAPEGPLNVVVEGSAAKLSWKPPMVDGNSTILGYYVEKFDEKKKSWNFVARCTEPNYTTEMSGAELVRFRVAAENAIGLGSFIESKAVSAGTKPEILRPKGDAIYAFNEGDKAELKFTFKGEPAPKVEWIDSFGSAIISNADYTIKNTSTSTSLTIKSVAMKHGGEYFLKVKNSIGEDVLPLKIEVKSCPEAPGKPSAEEQKADSLRLSWSSPAHDGGSPITQYIIEMRTVS